MSAAEDGPRLTGPRLTGPRLKGPRMTGRQHWLEAEALLLIVAQTSGQSAKDRREVRELAAVHAALAASAPAYGFHQEAQAVVADSPNITPGKDEGPRGRTSALTHAYVHGEQGRCGEIVSRSHHGYPDLVCDLPADLAIHGRGRAGGAPEGDREGEPMDATERDTQVLLDQLPAAYRRAMDEARRRAGVTMDAAATTLQRVKAPCLVKNCPACAAVGGQA